MSKELKELQARLIRRTEQSMATALRDAETIRRLKAALPCAAPCGWESGRAGTYATGCGRVVWLNGITYDSYTYCPWCGKKIKEVRP